MVAQCFTTLNVYGKTADQLNDITKMFLLVLARQDIAEIIDSFTRWMMRNSVMPTPADIMNLIEPPPEKPKESVYIEINRRRREGHYITEKERAFCREYESENVEKVIN